MRFVKPKFSIKQIGSSMYNGSSEFVTSISTAITTLAFNFLLFGLVGKMGVTAISIILYVQAIQMAVYTGFSFSISPIISYKYGEQDHDQLKKIVRLGLIFIAVASVVIIGLSLALAGPAVSIFINKTSETFLMAKQGLMVFSIAYLFMGFNVYIATLFTALSNGKISAILSGIRTFVFTIACLISLPAIFGAVGWDKLIGVWIAVPIAEFLMIFVSFAVFKKYRKKYNY